ncbi:MAG: hypothetical protein A3I44_06415 [Candidatus Sungbacteria bacterium RIFCSPLOWO2_02_FULL_51_17]|uniref:endopeptidase La n=1 Tax=Candidatus Sungbacteria bacterium RIFCSPHIGHO2_02_FULL_51_29 TaxID=1802273 RepID=A0A1G2KT06_9BACT|nr:MAG: hypothetical protein A2676_04885 [Candidatus Sungbacteria bacterium RIFCSPHIGHO2_01_FULL_51_22]OHA02394.1 MAG: hypothetical protein A3C16_02260 [Candidatus Sungbacteria bacterium RIFCSPHIGHO2_02_FULL_51_29]OHA11124.1 MAG: hypothetical protein A3I44_06415 [Candidatus Sungbacteria bacterium RIFCSPLOWO2_02_FULL_51_17]
MAEIGKLQIPSKLPVLIVGDGALFPPLDVTIQFYLNEPLRDKIRETKAVLIGTDTNPRKTEDVAVSRAGLLAAVVEGPSDSGEPDLYNLRLQGLFRCFLKNTEKITGGRGAQLQAEWELMPGDDALTPAEWSDAVLQQKIIALKNMLGPTMELHSYIVPNFATSKFSLLYAKVLALFVDFGPTKLGEILDRIALIIAFSTVMPPRFPLGHPVRKRISRELYQALVTTNHAQRLEIVLNLMETFLEILENEVARHGAPSRGADDETDGKSADDIMKRYKEAEKDIPEHVKKVLKREIKKLSTMPPSASEYFVTENYIDWLLRIPWGKETKDAENLAAVETVLNEDHWGLDDVKERIIEYLAATKFNPKMKSPILGFVGPPGVGKTSLGKSIARGLGRKFHRMSVGGIDDEAEIRGHRRTYVGALPGRFIDALATAETMNPIVMIDEVDKLGTGAVKGDPRAALLEVLDPEQNAAFVDNYLGVGVDLSKVFFIVTANTLDTVHGALRDRIEWINFYSYTEDEKVHIAQRFLVPKEIKENGLSPEQFQERGQAPVVISFTDEALRTIVNEYVLEAGVRTLERKIAKVLRKVVAKIAKHNVVRQPDEERRAGQPDNAWEITENNLKFYFEETERIIDRHKLFPTLKVGVAPMLAVSEAAGGQLFYIEARQRKNTGKRKIKVTGFDPNHEEIGTMLEESVDTAWDYLTCNGGPLESSLPENMYLRVNFANGGIPKDGPSAGVPILWALYSLFTNQPIKSGLVATGEITLTMGNVLAVGGIKEKILGAARAGAKEVIIPSSVVHELKDVPDEIKGRVTIIPCSSMLETLKLAFPGDSALQARTE